MRRSLAALTATDRLDRLAATDRDGYHPQLLRQSIATLAIGIIDRGYQSQLSIANTDRNNCRGNHCRGNRSLQRAPPLTPAA